MNELIKQEKELVDFFLLNAKPALSISKFSPELSRLKNYPRTLSILTRQVMYFKTIELRDFYNLVEESLIKLNDDELITMMKFELLGTMFGFPPTAVDYFINNFSFSTKVIINYEGLIFVCKRGTEEQIYKELEEMYKKTK